MNCAATVEAFKLIVARRLELEPAVLFGTSLKLSTAIARSPQATNSIDLVEAFAGAMAELEIDDRLELPAMTLENTMDDVVDQVRAQLLSTSPSAS